MLTPPLPCHWFSWTAALAGAIVGVGLNFLLNLLALGLGIASFSTSISGQTQFSLGGFACFCIAAVIAMFSTGWVAGKLTPRVLVHPLWGAFYGFAAWSLLLIFTLILITNMVQFAAFHTNFTANLVEIRLKNNSPMLTQTIFDLKNNPPLKINIESTTKIVTLNAVLTFVLFFVGALASCLGGFLGYRGKPPLRFTS